MINVLKVATKLESVPHGHVGVRGHTEAAISKPSSVSLIRKVVHLSRQWKVISSQSESQCNKLDSNKLCYSRVRAPLMSFVITLTAAV